MARVVLHLGTNLGFKEINLELARIMISNHIGELCQVSSLYKTAPWGKGDQPEFYNQAVIVESGLAPEAVLEAIHLIEQKMGRTKEEHWGPRIIDVDILFHGENIIDKPQLKIPHPEMSKRNFVLRPLMEICPDKQDPRSGKTIRVLSEECGDTLEVQRMI